ncbi:MAG: hypothetical protein FWE33_05735 [Defluviitaleaceae bacterium]|nr:hypothetical protein [Defluviitaleaceae bacterium]
MGKVKQVHTFWDEYQESVAPKIADIDVYLKSAEHPFDIGCVADLLELDEAEIYAILRDAGVKSIDKNIFLYIMTTGSSFLCGLYRREVELNSPPTYTANDLAYIYNLDILAVNNACQTLQINEVTSFTMPLIFANIPWRN